MELSRIEQIVREARGVFEKGDVYGPELEQIYRGRIKVGPKWPWPPLDQLQEHFPEGNCAVATAYLGELIPESKIVYGYYEDRSHFFLLLDPVAVVDITADQFGGPKVYVGPLETPWQKLGVWEDSVMLFMRTSSYEITLLSSEN